MANLKSTPNFVGYCRVSTQRQGESGLGLEAQEAAIRHYVNGGTLLAQFVEIESGKRTDNRPKLAEALALCRKKRATLIIAKLDRLSRNVAFISALLESSVRIKCADMPEADRAFLQMLAVFAEHETRRISQRTREALAAAKNRGVKLGNPKLLQDKAVAREIGIMGGKVNRDRAAEFARNVAPIITDIERSGAVTLRQIAAELTARGIKAPGGGEWNAMTVSKIRRRSVERTQDDGMLEPPL